MAWGRKKGKLLAQQARHCVVVLLVTTTTTLLTTTTSTRQTHEDVCKREGRRRTRARLNTDGVLAAILSALRSTKWRRRRALPKETKKTKKNISANHIKT